MRRELIRVNTELDKRSGNAGRAERQVTANRRFVEAVKLIARRDKNR